MAGINDCGGGQRGLPSLVRWPRDGGKIAAQGWELSRGEHSWAALTGGMLNRSLGAIFDTGTTFDALINVYRHRFAALQLVNGSRTDLHAGTVTATAVIVHRDRHLVAFPGFDIHCCSLFLLGKLYYRRNGRGNLLRYLNLSRQRRRRFRSQVYPTVGLFLF